MCQEAEGLVMNWTELQCGNVIKKVEQPSDTLDTKGVMGIRFDLSFLGKEVLELYDSESGNLVAILNITDATVQKVID